MKRVKLGLMGIGLVLIATSVAHASALITVLIFGIGAMDAKGDAQLTLEPNTGYVEVSNVGSSGKDGYTILLPGASRYDAYFIPPVPAGGPFGMTLEALDIDGQMMSSARLEDDPNGDRQFYVDFQSATYKVEILREGNVVYSQSGVGTTQVPVQIQDATNLGVTVTDAHAGTGTLEGYYIWSWFTYCDPRVDADNWSACPPPYPAPPATPIPTFETQAGPVQGDALILTEEGVVGSRRASAFNVLMKGASSLTVFAMFADLPSVPTLSAAGTALLVVLLGLSAIWLIRKRSARTEAA